VIKVGPRGRWVNGMAPFAHKMEEGKGTNRPPREGDLATSLKSPERMRGGESQPGMPMECISEFRVPACPSTARKATSVVLVGRPFPCQRLARLGVTHNPRLSPGSEDMHKAFPLSHQKKG